MKKTLEETIINERAGQLEKIGFKFKVDENHCWYEKGEVRMIPTLMMCASEIEWQEFIKLHSEPEVQASVARDSDSSTSSDQQNNSSIQDDLQAYKVLYKNTKAELENLQRNNSGEQQQVTGGMKNALESILERVKYENRGWLESPTETIDAIMEICFNALASQPPTPEPGKVVTGELYRLRKFDKKDETTWPKQRHNYFVRCKGFNGSLYNATRVFDLKKIYNTGSNPTNWDTTDEVIEWLEKVEPRQQNQDELTQVLNLAQAELRAMYKRLGINGSNVLELIDNKLNLLIKKDK